MCRASRLPFWKWWCSAPEDWVMWVLVYSVSTLFSFFFSGLRCTFSDLLVIASLYRRFLFLCILCCRWPIFLTCTVFFFSLTCTFFFFSFYSLEHLPFLLSLMFGLSWIECAGLNECMSQARIKKTKNKKGRDQVKFYVCKSEWSFFIIEWRLFFSTRLFSQIFI